MRERFCHFRKYAYICSDEKDSEKGCLVIGDEIIHIPDGYLDTFRQFLATRTIGTRS